MTKYKYFYLIIFLVFINFFTLKGQISTLIPYECLPGGSNQVWKDAGSTNFSDGITVDQFIDVTQLEISTSLSDNSGILNTKISAANPPTDEFIVFYFPSSGYQKYTFLNPINLKSNIIIKGECATKVNGPLPVSEFYFDLGANEIKLSTCFNINGCKNVGFQDFYVHQEPRVTGTAWNNTSFTLSDYKNYTFNFSNAEDCWIQGVYSKYTQSHHIQIVNSKYITVFGNFFWGANDYSNTGRGRGYGVQLNDESQYCLIENNIFSNLRHAFVIQQDALYNIFSYNYALMNYAYNCSWPDYMCFGKTLQDIAFHGSKIGDDGVQTGGPKYNLCEGNFVDFIEFDDVHSYNGPYNVLFRNYAGKIKFEGGGLSQSEKHDYQFKQVIVGDNDNPNYENYKDIRDYGCYQTFWYKACGIWDVCPLWQNLPYYHYSYYKENTPDWWPSGEQWPYVPNEGNPSKDRMDIYIPNENELVILSCWDSKSYKNMCAPGIFYPGKEITQPPSLQTNFKATEYITASYAIQNADPVTFAAGQYIELLPGFETFEGGEFEAYIDEINCSGSGQKILPYQYNPPPPVVIPSNKNNITKTDSVYFNLTPNPCKTFVQIEYSTNNDRDVIIEIYNIAGNKLKQHIYRGGKNTETLDISELTNGIYTYRVYNRDKAIKMEKLVVIK